METFYMVRAIIPFNKWQWLLNKKWVRLTEATKYQSKMLAIEDAQDAALTYEFIEVMKFERSTVWQATS